MAKEKQSPSNPPPAGDAAGEKKSGTSKRKGKKNVATGIAHIQSTFNNTIVTITDVQGNVLSWSSAGARAIRPLRSCRPAFAAVSVRVRRAIANLR